MRGGISWARMRGEGEGRGMSATRWPVYRVVIVARCGSVCLSVRGWSFALLCFALRVVCFALFLARGASSFHCNEVMNKSWR